MEDCQSNLKSESLLAFRMNTKQKELLRAYLDNRGVTMKDFFTSFITYSLKLFDQQGLWDRGPYYTIHGKRCYLWDDERRRKHSNKIIKK